MLRQEDINIAGHITAANTATAKRVFQSVPGIGYATASYFLMLLGAPGIKPDRMIHRFLQDATGSSRTRPATRPRTPAPINSCKRRPKLSAPNRTNSTTRSGATRAQAQRRRLLAANTLPAWHDSHCRLGAADRHVCVVNYAHHVLSWGLAARRGT